MDVAAGYIRKNHEVEAAQVSYERFQEIAEWCGGLIKSTKEDLSVGTLYIRVPVVRSRHNKPNRAYVGDWILKDGDGFKIYTSEAFANSYKPIIPDSKKYDAVLKLVKFAMLEQDSATFHGNAEADMGKVAEQIARKILEIA